MIVCWVIQKFKMNVPLYWTGCSDSSSEWSESMEDACRFADQISAEKVLRNWCEGNGRVLKWETPG